MQFTTPRLSFIKKERNSSHKKGFTIVEMLIVTALMLMIFTAAYYSFINSYSQIQKGTARMENIHAVAIILELLRHEITALPDFRQIEEEFYNTQDLDWIQFENVDPASSNSQAETVRYSLDKESNSVIREVSGKQQSFGQGRILEFKFTHNIDLKDPKFPTWIRVDVKTIDEHKSEVQLNATIYPRLINRNIQLERNI